jgi:hypothetical protein
MNLFQLAKSEFKSEKCKFRLYLTHFYVIAKSWKSSRRDYSISTPSLSEQKRILDEAFNVLLLAEDLREKILQIALEKQVSAREEFLQLVEFSCEIEWINQYEDLVIKESKILNEETAWLSLSIRRALNETSGHAGWSLLFMTFAYKAMLCRRIEYRLNPHSVVNSPSAFVYAMH